MTRTRTLKATTDGPSDATINAIFTRASTYSVVKCQNLLYQSQIGAIPGMCCLGTGAIPGTCCLGTPSPINLSESAAICITINFGVRDLRQLSEASKSESVIIYNLLFSFQIQFYEI